MEYTWKKILTLSRGAVHVLDTERRGGGGGGGDGGREGDDTHVQG